MAFNDHRFAMQRRNVRLNLSAVRVLGKYRGIAGGRFVSDMKNRNTPAAGVFYHTFSVRNGDIDSREGQFSSR